MGAHRLDRAKERWPRLKLVTIFVQTQRHGAGKRTWSSAEPRNESNSAADMGALGRVPSSGVEDGSVAKSMLASLVRPLRRHNAAELQR